MCLTIILPNGARDKMSVPMQIRFFARSGPFMPIMSAIQDERLEALKEDLAEWIRKALNKSVTAETLIEVTLLDLPKHVQHG